MKNKIKFANGSEITFKKTEESDEFESSGGICYSDVPPEEFKSADIFNYINGKTRTEFENEPKMILPVYIPGDMN